MLTLYRESTTALIISKVKYITKSDLLKGYSAIPLTDSAKEIAFVTPQGNYKYCVMPFGM